MDTDAVELRRLRNEMLNVAARMETACSKKDLAQLTLCRAQCVVLQANRADVYKSIKTKEKLPPLVRK